MKPAKKAADASLRAPSAGPNEPLALLHFAFRAVIQVPDEQLLRRGFGRVHHRILFFIAQNPGLRVADLLATLGTSKQALHRPLQELLRAKLVVSRTEPANLRERRLSLTVRGETLEERLSGYQRSLFAAAFRKAGPAAAEGWRTVMRELMRRLPPAPD
jgi:DNA-binding MarR family transcriptional regulator